jgi:hypothetical protein
VLVVTEAALIDSEKVTEILSVIAIELSLSVGEVDNIVGAVVSIIKELTESVSLVLPALSDTLIVQSLYVAALSVLKVITLFPDDAEEVELLQLPP